MSNKHKCICAGCDNEHDDRGKDDHPDSHQWYVNLGVPSECMCNYGLEGYPDCPGNDTVTITISREAAKDFLEAYWDPDKECDCAGCQVVPVIRAALKETE